MPFLLKDETAGVDVIYIDNSGHAGIMGSANAGQALSFQGIDVVSTDAMISPGLAGPGTPSPFAGTIVIPISGSVNVSYSVPQIPTVMSTTDPSSVSTTAVTFTNSSTTSASSVTYKIW
jgi:hypothetical protein